MLAQVNGIQIHYEWTGKKQGEVVLFSHALGSSLVMWRPQLAALEPDYRILRYDMRGHGESDVPKGPYTLEQLGEDVVGLLDAVGVEQAHYVGLSVGGMIGQNLGLAHSARFRSLTLSNTSSVTLADTKTSLQERIDTARAKGLQGLVQSTMERWFTLPFIQRASPDYRMIREQFLRTPLEGYIGCCQAIQGLNYGDRLAGISLPVLVIAAKEEPGEALPRARVIHERIKGSKFVILSPAQHAANVEQPEAFNAALVEFLRARGRQ